MIPNQRNKYFETAVQTATPQQLLIMLCDGAIRNCKQGVEAINNHQYELAHTSLTKVQDIINEFIITLDKKAAVADGLLKLYDYFLFRLMEANTQKQAAPAQEVLTFLLELKETWLLAAKSTSTPKTTAKQYG